MSDTPMTVATQLAVIVPEVWSARWYDVLLAELPFNSLVDRNYEGEIRDLGDTVNISSFPEFDIGDVVAEADGVDAKAITVTGQQLVIDTRVAKDFIVTKLSIAQSLPAMDKLRDLAIYAIMKKMQALIIAAIVPSSSPDHTIAYNSGTTLALVDILAAKRLLDAQNVPAPDRHMVMGSSQTNDIFNITGFTSSDFLMAGAPLQSGVVPAGLLGFSPHMTTLATSNVSTFFHRSFMTLAVQQGLNIAQYDQAGISGKRHIRVNTDVLFGLKQLSDKRSVTVS